MKYIAAAIGILVGSACTSDRIDLYHTDFDPHTQARWTSVVGPLDSVGGPRQALLCKADLYGSVQHCWDTNGPGTLQTFMAGGFAGMVQAAGFAGGMAALRPSTTNVTTNSTTSGGSIAPGAASASASPVAAGGAGGRGGAGGTGGNPTATANPTAVGGAASANPVVTARSGNATGGTVANTNTNAPTVANTNTNAPTVANTNTNAPTISATVDPSIRVNSSVQSSAAAAAGPNSIGSADSNKCVGGVGCTNN